ncbi:PQQ-binding-like beta-propeller repeat protein [Natronococcus sp. A-GB7]|uniref:PQQ-binding-like beta-propeller repeat protein n=1 Tax=Natronococcus sp. A-GB7 TaxID=3037649 RepID=UPI00241EC98F|nr:PQQ-binding-like beta-propeller repeat protein [Natronococcus sp. A-GB7]MDG5819950.1 PQQ-like beta-propeller repeat protein [Natronococcus sp. A-GB7]
MTGYGRRQVLKRTGIVAIGGTLAVNAAVADDRAITDSASAGSAVRSDTQGWTSRRGNPGNTGYAPEASGPDDPAVVEWRRDATGPVAVVDGVVYQTDDGAVHAFDADDGDRIETSPDVGADGAPTVADGRIYVGGDRLAVLDADLEGIEWTIGFEDDVPEPIVAEGSAFVVVDGILYAIDAAEGTERWRSEGNGRKLHGRAVAVADGAVFVTDGRTLYALEASDGSRRWANHDGGFRKQVVVATDDTVSVQAGGLDEIAVYETDSGDLRWIGDGYASALATDDRVYALTGPDVVGYDRKSGEEQWRPGLESATYGPPVADGEKLYVGIESANQGPGIVAFDLEEGTVEWSIETDAQPGDLAIADNTLYAVADELLAIRAESAFDDIDANETDGDNVTQPENGNDTFDTEDPEDIGDDADDSGDGDGNETDDGETESADEVLGDDDGQDEGIPGFTTGAGILGGAVALEWLRRSAGVEPVESESE